MCTKTSGRGAAVWVPAAALVVCAVAVIHMVGCAQDMQTTTSLGDWPDREAPLVLSGDSPDRAVGAYDAARKDLSAAQWEILERYAPRSVWDRLREREDDIKAARKRVAAARALRAKKTTTQPAKLPDVPTETLSNGQIQMYYRIRHYGGVLVTSGAAGHGSGLSRRTITVKPGDMTTLASLVSKRLAGKGAVSPLPADQVLIITCAPEMKKLVLELLARVDVPTPQVEITARIFEVQHDMDFQMGVKLLLNHAGASTDRGAFGQIFSAEDFANKAMDPMAGMAAMQDPSAAMRIVNIFGDSGWSTDTTIQAMAMTGLIKLVSSPRMTVTVGNTGYVLAGQEVPIASATEANNNVIISKITYKPVGVQLYVTPQIIGTDSVKLHVVTIASEITGFQALSGLGGANQATVNPVFDTREAETYVTVPDKSALVIGGLRRVRTITRENKIPGLGDIPYLGWLFKSHRSQTQITDLYFFVTPRIIHQ